MPNRFYADLHTHSFRSDGTFTPSELVEHARKIGLGGLSLTDHDTVGGIEEALTAAARGSLKVVPGIEMGADAGGRDIHILGYYIDYKDQAFLGELKNLKAMRLERAEEMCSRLTAKGLPITLEESLALTPGDVLTRAHIARAVVAKGHASSVNEVFDRYLGNGKPCFVPKYNLTPEIVIARILDAGGLPVLAHPLLSRADGEIERFVQHGLRGVEAYCVDHKPADIKRYLRIADRYNLVVTGGSDCHGPNTPGRFLMGRCGVTEERFKALEEAAGQAA